MITYERTIHSLDVQCPSHTRKHTDAHSASRDGECDELVHERARDQPQTTLPTTTMTTPITPASATRKSASMELLLLLQCCSVSLAPRLSASCETGRKCSHGRLGVMRSQADRRNRRSVSSAAVRLAWSCHRDVARTLASEALAEPANYSSHPPYSYGKLGRSAAGGGGGLPPPRRRAAASGGWRGRESRKSARDALV